MDTTTPPLIPPTASLTHTLCHIRHVRWSLSTLPCARCGAPARRRCETSRTAIDIDLEHPVLLLVTVSVHHCRRCGRYMRAQPPFLRRDAIYTARVVTKAVPSVYVDGMAVRRVPARLARDFWVQPSEGMIRQWCRAYCAGLDFAGDYQAWVVEEFSGILGVDDVYQGALALLLAVDPAAPEGDRLVGYELVQGTVDKEAIAAFLHRLKDVGINPEQVITDGSSLYPAVLAQIWPAAAHQLCLFHETRQVTEAALTVINAVRKMPPVPPPGPGWAAASLSTDGGCDGCGHRAVAPAAGAAAERDWSGPAVGSTRTLAASHRTTDGPAPQDREALAHPGEPRCGRDRKLSTRGHGPHPRPVGAGRDPTAAPVAHLG